MKFTAALVAAFFMSAANAETSVGPLPTQKNWVYEFEFFTIVYGSYLALPDCKRAAVTDPRWPEAPRSLNISDPLNPRWNYSCGGNQLAYTHFLGRRCLNKRRFLKRIETYCGWRHKSHVSDSSEIHWEGIGFMGRVEF